MTNKTYEINLLDSYLIGNWVTKWFDIWQLRFVSDSELGRIAHDRGLMSLTLGNDIKNLWYLGLLQADLVESSTELTIKNLNLVEENNGNYFYSDSRRLDQNLDGWVDSISRLSEFPSGVNLFFHPFRYYTIYHIDRILRTKIHPIQMLTSSKNYVLLLQKIISEFNEWSKSSDFYKQINHWNDVAALAIASEPHTFTRIFGIKRRSLRISEEDHNNLINEFWNEFKSEFIKIDIENIKKICQELVLSAETLDDNKSLHTLIRLTEGEMRIKSVKGKLGGAIYLKTMSEMIRRCAENAFNIKLPEEDELGFGTPLARVKEKLFGTERLLDSTQNIKNQYIRGLGLDYGTKLRWYVEGDTEYYGLYAYLNWFTQIDFVNLRGNVVAKGGKGLSFVDSLRSDLRGHIFSFISLDGDDSSNIKVFSKAAEDDYICGMAFISKPDFEFANFTLEELSQIAWGIAIDAGVNPREKELFINSVAHCKSGKEFENQVPKSNPLLNQFNKGKDWGERLMKYAHENPEFTTNNNIKRIRPIMNSINLAIKAATVDDYLATRKMFKVDPESGMPIKRE